MTTLNQLPPQVAIGRTLAGEQIYATKAFYDIVFTDLYNRVGGATAPTNNEVDEFLQFDVREADAGEISKRLDSVRTHIEQLPDSTAAVAQLQRIVSDLQVIADSLSSNAQALCAVLANRASDIETLQAFTR